MSELILKFEILREMEQVNEDVNANLDPSNRFRFCNKTLACGHG